MSTPTPLQHEMFHNRSGCCFWIPCLGSSSHSHLSPASSFGSVWSDQFRTSDNKDPWRMSPCKKIREWSEILPGLKWKTFIRRFNKTRTVAYSKQNTYQYDPLSYALNFDDGMEKKVEDNHGYLNFSSRFASIPVSAKSSVDVGKDGPTFT